MISIGVGQGTSIPLTAYGISVSDITPTWRAIGGCWQLTARLVSSDLPVFMDQWLGATIEHPESDWFGRIVTLDMSYGFTKKRYDLLEKYANRVVTQIGTASIETWSEDDSDIERFGSYEIVLAGDADINGTQADDWSDRTLAKRLALREFGIGINREYAEVPAVDLTAVGLLPLTARIKNNILAGTDRIGVDISGLGDQNLSTVIDDLCDNWSDSLLSSGLISPNTTTIDQDLITGTNTWAMLEELAGWDDDASYKIDSDRDGNVRYYAVASSESDPDYEIRVDGIRARGSSNVIPAWQCRPGWYRDTTTGSAFYGREIRARAGDLIPDILVPDIDTDVYLDTNFETWSADNGG